MTIFLSTVLLASLFLFLGLAFCFEAFKTPAFRFLRSQAAALVLVSVAGAWFLWILYNLTEADFGQYKYILMAVFGGAGILSFKYLPDFLSVRGLSVLMILALREFLNSAYMVDGAYKFLFVLDCYLLVVAFVYFGCLPYRMRDLFEWIFEKSARRKMVAAVFILEAVSLFAVSLTY